MTTLATSPEIRSITAHDLYAAAALNAIINDKDMVRAGGQALRSDPHGFIAKIAFNVADAMMAEREQRLKKGSAA